MSRTEIDGDQIYDGSVQKKDIDITTVGESVITSLAIIGTGITLTETGADSGTGIASLELESGNFGTEYHAYESVAEQTDISNGWVQKALFTTPVLPSGYYIVHYRAQITNTSKKTVGFQVRFQEDALGFEVLEESFNAPTTANVYETRGTFDEVQILNDNTADIEINFGQTTSGGTAKIKNVVVYLFKVGELA